MNLEQLDVSQRVALAHQRKDMRPDEPGEHAARVVEFSALDTARARVLRLVTYILRGL
jgi:hypothetical protein